MTRTKIKALWEQVIYLIYLIKVVWGKSQVGFCSKVHVLSDDSRLGGAAGKETDRSLHHGGRVYSLLWWLSKNITSLFYAFLFHVLPIPLGSAFRFKSSVVCLLRVPPTYFPHSWTITFKSGIWPVSSRFWCLWKTGIFPGHGVRNQVYFPSNGELAENYGLSLGYVVHLLLGRRHHKLESEATATWSGTTK